MGDEKYNCSITINEKINHLDEDDLLMFIGCMTEHFPGYLVQDIDGTIELDLNNFNVNGLKSIIDLLNKQIKRQRVELWIKEKCHT